MNAKYLFQKETMHANAIRHIGDTETRARQERGFVWASQDSVAQPISLSSRALRDVTVDETGKIQLELVSITLSVRALDLAQFALKTGVHHRRRLGWRDLAN